MKLNTLRGRLMGRFYLILAIAIATSISGMATGFGLFYRVLYVLGLTAVLSFIWNWLSLESLEVRADRRTPRVRVGDPIEGGLTVHNLSRLPKQSLEVEDLTSLPGASNVNVINLHGRGAGYLDVELVARKRGIYDLGPVRITHTDPFGLFRKERLFGGVEKVMVYPRVYDLPTYYVPAAYMTGETSSMKRAQSVTPQASSVREYVVGDSLSRIHWNSTAKLRRLMSKEFDLGRTGEVWVMVDLHRDAQAGELEESTDEYAVSIAASLAKRYLQSQLPLGLIVYGDRRHLLPAETGSGQYQRILDSLAVCKAEGVTPLEAALQREEPLWGHRSSLVVITASPRHEWALALESLARRGVKVASILLDGASFGASFNSLDVLDRLLAVGIPTHVVRKGDDIREILGRPYTVAASRAVGEPRQVEVTA